MKILYLKYYPDTGFTSTLHTSYITSRGGPGENVPLRSTTAYAGLLDRKPGVVVALTFPICIYRTNTAWTQ